MSTNLENSRARPLQSKTQRPLACLQCQQRKVKCDRKSPCINCIKHQRQCIPTSQTRPRKRRFPERELLDQLRKYEHLLRQNNVSFDPLHTSQIVEESKASDSEGPEIGETISSPPLPEKSDSTYQAKSFWHAMSHGIKPLNNGGPPKNYWGQIFKSDDHIMLSSGNPDIELATLHPEPVQIFKLWQIYLDNVNPLFKVTHTPSLQGRIIEAASDLLNTQPPLAALMFGIYCISIFSLAPEDCETIFSLSKEDLLSKYQFACQLALSKSSFLRSEDRDCLTAFYLFLVSLSFNTDPRSISSMLGIATRNAQRMGIHNESVLARSTVFEAEMRRRLWWSLLFFEARMSELDDSQTMTYNPTWDIKIPLNVNDSELWVEMKELPRAQGKATEALFAVVRSKVGDFIRNTPFFLDFTNPAFKGIAKNGLGKDLAALERSLEEDYFQFCNPANPLHYMTMWNTRGQIARYHLMEIYSKNLSSSQQASEKADAVILHAIRFLECDTKIMSSSLTKSYRWLLHLYFPFPAYISIVQIFTRYPTSQYNAQAWEAMDANYEARFGSLTSINGPLFSMFSGVILQGWKAVEIAIKQSGGSAAPPKLVATIRQRLTEASSNIPSEQINDLDFVPNHPLIPMLADDNLLSSLDWSNGFTTSEPMGFPSIADHPMLPFDTHHSNWVSMVWSLHGRT
ncbi:hypothetical protein N7495_007089 [Penicillium taxi]|uniref:uncharacterized protein n=1 Tax=Penicillium taxi TaxID=168475 RepID=UPI002544FE14|nr:uncharacterized protein N7495_007089 [Penicillium taxi]KAJ5895398.1 hypothetical protein N7495_007089 [Penicillium taxi]